MGLLSAPGTVVCGGDRHFPCYGEKGDAWPSITSAPLDSADGGAHSTRTSPFLHPPSFPGDRHDQAIALRPRGDSRQCDGGPSRLARLSRSRPSRPGGRRQLSRPLGASGECGLEGQAARPGSIQPRRAWPPRFRDLLYRDQGAGTGTPSALRGADDGKNPVGAEAVRASARE